MNDKMSERISPSALKICEPPDPQLKMDDMWNIWRGTLFISKKLVGKVNIWAHYNNFIPNLGKELHMQSRLSIEKFWSVIMNSQPCQLSFDRETILSNGRAVSVHIISSNTWKFMQLHQELNKITIHSPGKMSLNSSPIVLVGTVINPGVGVEVVLAPPCQQTEDMGLTLPHSVQQPLMYAIFITSKCAAEARKIYKLQRDYELQNMTLKYSSNENGENVKLPQKSETHDLNGGNKIKSEKDLTNTQDKEIKENHCYKEKHLPKYNNILDSKVEIKENSKNNSKLKENYKIGKKSLIDTMKFRSLFDSKAKKKPDMVKPSMLKRPSSKYKEGKANDTLHVGTTGSQKTLNVSPSQDVKNVREGNKIEFTSPEKTLGKSWKNLAMKYGLADQFRQKQSKYENSEKVSSHSKDKLKNSGIVMDKELKCTQKEILIPSKNKIDTHKSEMHHKVSKGTSNETSNIPSSTERISNVKIMLSNEERVSTMDRSLKGGSNSNEKSSSQDNSSCKDISNSKDGSLGINKCSVDGGSPSSNVPSKISPYKDCPPSLDRSPSPDKSVSKDQTFKKVKFREKDFKSKVSEDKTCNLKTSSKRFYSRSRFYRFKARFNKGSMSMKTIKLLKKLNIRNSILKGNKKCRNVKKSSTCQILEPAKPKIKPLAKETSVYSVPVSPFSENASVNYNNDRIDTNLNIITTNNKSLDAENDHIIEIPMKRKSDSIHESSSKKFKLEPMVMLTDIFNSLSAQNDAEIYKFVSQNLKKEVVSDDEDCQHIPEKSKDEANGDVILIKEEKLSPSRSKSKSHLISHQIAKAISEKNTSSNVYTSHDHSDTKAASKNVEDSENISTCSVSEKNDTTSSANDLSSLVTLDSQKGSAQYVKKQKPMNVSNVSRNVCNSSKADTFQKDSLLITDTPEIIDISLVRVKTEVDENLAGNISGIIDMSISPDISEIIDIPLSKECFITKNDVKILDNVLKRFKSSSLNVSFDSKIKDEIGLSQTKMHEKLKKQDDKGELRNKDKEIDKIIENLESKSGLASKKEIFNNISKSVKSPVNESKSNSKNINEKKLKEIQSFNCEDKINCRNSMTNKLASEIDDTPFAVFGSNAELEMKEILSDWTTHRFDGLDFLTSITKEMTTSKYLDIQPSKKLEMTIGDLSENFTSFDLGDIDTVIYNEILKLNLSTMQKYEKEISNKCNRDLDFKSKNTIQVENGNKGTSCIVCSNKSKKIQTLPDEVGPFHFDDTYIKKENSCNLKLKKWIHLYNAKEGDAKKLKVVAPMCCLKAGSLEQVCEDGGFVFLQQEDIQSFLTGGKSALLLPQDNITFCPFSSIKKIFEGTAMPILTPGCLLLIHHTTLFDEGFSTTLGPLIEEGSSKDYPLFIPIATLRDCLEVLEKITVGKSKKRRILSKNMYIITRCINKGIVSVLIGEGRWQGLGPCSSNLQYIDALKALHIHTGLQTRKASLLIGKMMQRPEIPGLVYGTKLPQFAFG